MKKILISLIFLPITAFAFTGQKKCQSSAAASCVSSAKSTAETDKKSAPEAAKAPAPASAPAAAPVKSAVPASAPVPTSAPAATSVKAAAPIPAQAAPAPSTSTASPAEAAATKKHEKQAKSRTGKKVVEKAAKTEVVAAATQVPPTPEKLDSDYAKSLVEAFRRASGSSALITR